MPTDERGDPRLTNFLLGFFFGALIAGGGGFAFSYYQTQRLMAAAQVQAMVAERLQAEAEAVRRLAEIHRGAAEAELARAREELRKAKAK